MSRFLFATLLAVLLAPSAAQAVAKNEKVTVEKLRDANKKVVGFRVHGTADPEGYDHMRVNIGKTAVDPALRSQPGFDHRALAAGIKPGYVRAQIHDVQGIPFKAGSSQHELQEFHLDVHYGVNNDLAPGDKVDIYSTYGTGPTPGYWHVYGMHQGPVQSGDTTHVHELPTETSTHGEATQFGPE